MFLISRFIVCLLAAVLSYNHLSITNMHVFLQKLFILNLVPFFEGILHEDCFVGCNLFEG